MIFGAFIIAALAVLVLVVFFRKQTDWWEYLIIIVVPIILIFGAKLLIKNSMQKSQELWGGFVVEATFWEEYKENVQHSSETCTGSGESRSCYTTYYTTCDRSGPRWDASENNNIGFGISSDTWERLARQFGNRKHKDVKGRDYCGGDRWRGGKWVTEYQMNDEALEPVISRHSYKNPIVVSSSSLKLPMPSEDEISQYKLFKYPKMGSSTVLGYNAVPFVMSQNESILGFKEAREQLIFHNAKFGHMLQQAIWILVFESRSQEVARLQEALWQRGNKNELVICIGVDEKQQVQWSYVFSWMETAGLHVAVESAVMEQRDQALNLSTAASDATKLSASGWKRCEFAQFDYISFSPPLWATILVYVLTIFVVIGVMVFVIKNDFEAGGERRSYRRRWR